MSTQYLTLEDLLVLVDRLKVGPVRDVGLLDSARARPQASVFGEDTYFALEAKAAALLHSLVCNHALVDGNKRLGWAAAVWFLDLNGAQVYLEDDDAFELVMEIAEGKLDVHQIEERLPIGPIERS